MYIVIKTNEDSCARHLVDKTISSILFLKCLPCFSPLTKQQLNQRGRDTFQKSSVKDSGRIHMTVLHERWLLRTGGLSSVRLLTQLTSPPPLGHLSVSGSRRSEDKGWRMDFFPNEKRPGSHLGNVRFSPE